ncbi:rod shape-determining protein MreC [Cytophagales bacterium LB-30]|uniref:Cell shape-determining protein MreC n=1 Tax=Shiella aurantiaca TaxID=3058365 RepID=A0ABT8F2C9_9BACT|nr:rod shape-determining protein MreC [Shiella aurantiaca]MDN4164607.1 rod shape-determining protein MreC [Shiella aurantiaca]
MQRLFEFLYQYRAFFLFIFLEVVCSWLIVNYNRYQSAAFFNSSNALSGSIMAGTTATADYFRLGQVNQHLADENAQLRKQLLSTETKVMVVSDSSAIEKADSITRNQYTFYPAKVVNNSVRRYNNFLTLNKGLSDGIEVGMGVISAEGVVGKVRAVSEHYATVTSILHTNMSISARLQSSNTLCTVKWDGLDPTEAQVLYVPRHLKPQMGDTVSTSGFNAIYPESTPLGIITDIELGDSDAFYTITISLSTDFYTLSYVYVVKNHLLNERDSLETLSTVQDEE